ncbi:MAG: AAA family ATPase [Candidatus Altiarchaeales archaeon ex4484_96]|nr:MAG: AAA family ATPase [Candidatus Altiarchaeales archaeon ex4484_96]
MKDIYNSIMSEMGKVVVGQDNVIEEILVSIFSKNHALLEGYPGLGKTFTVSTLSQILDLDFKRVQCTPDLMPSDITGTYIVEEGDGRKTFKFEKGPVFTNILLADEINRATPKTQSALLEAMQERQVSSGNKTHKLDSPFFVLATQNPIEMEGTYPLPEAQLDRFLLKIVISYPEKHDEGRIIDLFTGDKKVDVKQLIHRDEFLNIQNLTRKVPISQENKDIVLDIVTRTRPVDDGVAREYLDYGASPRASIGLVLASKARALVRGRNYVSKEDIEKMAYPVLRHRIILNFESERKGVSTDDVIDKILKEVG